MRTITFAAIFRRAFKQLLKECTLFSGFICLFILIFFCIMFKEKFETWLNRKKRKNQPVANGTQASSERSAVPSKKPALTQKQSKELQNRQVSLCWAPLINGYLFTDSVKDGNHSDSNNQYLTRYRKLELTLGLFSPINEVRYYIFRLLPSPATSRLLHHDDISTINPLVRFNRAENSPLDENTFYG